MMAREYSDALELDQVYEEADYLAQAIWMFFEAGTSDDSVLTADRCIMCRHFAWQLTQHIKRLNEEFLNVNAPVRGSQQ